MSKTSALPFELEIKHDLHPRNNLDFLEYLPGDYGDGKVKVAYAKLIPAIERALQIRVGQVYDRLSAVLDQYPISKITFNVFINPKKKWVSKKSAKGIEITISKNEMHEILGTYWHPFYRDRYGDQYHIDERLVTGIMTQIDEDSFFRNKSFVPLGMMLTQLLKFKAQGTSELVNFLKGNRFIQGF